MADGMDPRALALAVAEFFETELELQEGVFVDPDGQLATVRGHVRYPDVGRGGTFYADGMERAARDAMLLVVGRHVPAPGA